jgi:DNA-binding NtrC family response regulator
MATAGIASADTGTFEALIEALEKAGHQAFAARSLVELDRLLRRRRADAFVVDLSLADTTGPGTVLLVRDRNPDSDIVVVADSYSRELDLRLREAAVLHLEVRPVEMGRIEDVLLHCLGKADRRASA